MSEDISGAGLRVCRDFKMVGIATFLLICVYEDQRRNVLKDIKMTNKTQDMEEKLRSPCVLSTVGLAGRECFFRQG